MKQSDPRKAYNALAKYFGLRARDAFLNAIVDTTVNGDETANASDQYSTFLEKIFSQGHVYASSEDLKKITKAPGDQTERFKKRIVVTPADDAADFGEVGNKAADGQGWGAKKDTKFNLKKMLEKAAPTVAATSTLTAIQVFPIATGLDVTDTEITSLFLNSLRSMEMSRAVPYIDIHIISTAAAVGEGNFAKAPKMSLGRFLGVTPNADTADPLLGKFMPPVKAEGSDNVPLNMVAGMEVFTTPQTLVNKTLGTTYSRATGGRTDIFRPFLGLIDLTIADQFSGGAGISHKSANINLKLFDKGRLNEVAEFVAPRRDPNIKFEITYGWSHPDGGNLAARASDADIGTRLGRLVDAMRTTEIYSLSNSGFNVQSDGTVDISLTLTMDGASELGTQDVTALTLTNKNAGSISLQTLYSQLMSIKSRLGSAPGVQNGSITIPTFLQSPDPSNVIALTGDTYKEMKTFYGRLLHKDNKDASLRKIGSDLYRIFYRKGKNKPARSSRDLLRASRADLCAQFIENLVQTPDPFIRANKSVDKGVLASGGLKENKDNYSRSKKHAYISYGKLMIAALGSAFAAEDTEIQFIFSSFNRNAAGVYDHNIAQFPIYAADLKDQLEKRMLTSPVVTTKDFIALIHNEIIGFQAQKASGLSDIFQPNARSRSGGTKTPSGSKKINDGIVKEALKGDPGAMLRVQKIERANLERLYGGPSKRVYPTFSPPRLDVRISKKRSVEDPKKFVLRVYFQDRSAGRLMSSADALMSLMDNGYVVQEDWTGESPKIRGALHNEVWTKNFKKLSDSENGLIGPPDAKFMKALEEALNETDKDQSAKDKVLNRAKTYRVLKKKPGNIRKFFYETSPYIFFGIEGSGIIDASLSAQADPNLTNLAILSRGSTGADNTVPKRPVNLPFEAHPSTLSLNVFGCPFLSLMQKYFIDFGTNTTMDNFYVVASVEHKVDSSGYKTALQLQPYDAYGKFVNLDDEVEKILMKSILADVASTPTAP